MSTHHFFSLTRAMQLFQVMRLGSVVLTSILLAKSGLPTAGIGTYETLLYLGSLMSFFWVNGLLQGIPPVYAQMDENARKPFIFNVFLVFCGIAAAVFILLLLGEHWVTPILTGRADVPYFRLFVLYLLLHLPSYPVEYYYLLRNKPVQIILWGCVSFGLQVLVLIGPLWAGYGLEGGLYGLLALGGLRFLWTLYLAFRYGKPVLDYAIIRKYLHFSMPLVVNVIVGNLIVMFDNWLVGWYFKDEHTFAIFRYGSREFPLAIALATALGTALVAKLAAEPEPGMDELKSKSTRLMHLVFPLTVLLVFLAGPLFPLVFNPDFKASAPLFVIYLLVTASRVLLPNAIVLARGAARVILWVGLLEMLVKVVLGFVFIHYWGLVGVAWSAVLACWVEKLALMLFLRKSEDLPVSRWLNVPVYLGYTVLLFGTYLISLYI